MPNLRKCKRHDCSNMLEYWSRKFYCSNACKQRDYRARTTPHYNVAANPYVKYCRCCGQRFEALHPHAQFHAQSCRQRFYREQRLLRLQEPRRQQFPESAYTISNSIT